MFDVLDIGASGLAVQRARLDTISANIANINTLTNARGENIPWRRRFAIIAPGQKDDPAKPGVHVREIAIDKSPFRRHYDPGHVLADKDGYVNLPNVDWVVEHVNALEASRAYEANVTMMEVTKSMMNSVLRLIA
jgi:flagellar basal-body rod protein FlgC